jgi:hypothetical protein
VWRMEWRMIRGDGVKGGIYCEGRIRTQQPLIVVAIDAKTLCVDVVLLVGLWE